MSESVNHDEYYKKKIQELEAIVKTLMPKEKVFTVKFSDSWFYSTDKPYTYNLGTLFDLQGTRLLVGARNTIVGTLQNNLTNEEFNSLYTSLSSYMEVSFTDTNGVNYIELFHKTATNANISIDYASPPTANIINGGIGHFFLKNDNTLHYDTPCFGYHKLDDVIMNSTLEIKIVYT